MLRKTLSSMAICFAAVFWGLQSNATFVPPDSVQVLPESLMRNANMTEQEFNTAIEKARKHYEPIVSSHGARLSIKGNWSDNTANAFARQMGSTWEVQMFGGLARHPEMTLDGFTMVICHELGHHLAGFTFRQEGLPFPIPLPIPFPGGASWAANEGQSDYFAAHSCGRELWASETETNATFRNVVPATAKQSCDQTWQSQEERDLCYRINVAGVSLSHTLHALCASSDRCEAAPQVPEFETPDSNAVASTNHNHPAAQCRLDTTYAASLCTQDFDPMVIPAKKLQDQSGPEAEKEAARYTCMEADGFNEGVRPRCWFKPGI